MSTKTTNNLERNSMIAVGIMILILLAHMVWLFVTLSYSANERQCIKAKNTEEYKQLKCEGL